MPVVPSDRTQPKPMYVKWNVGFTYTEATHPLDQNLIMLMSINSPKTILNVTKGAIETCFSK